MGLAAQYAIERRERLIRLGVYRPTPAPKPALVKPKPRHNEPDYSGMWFYNLVNYKPLVPSIVDIQKACAAHFKIPLMSIINHRQIACATIPRQVGMYLARQLTTESKANISRAFYRDGSTVSHGIARIEKLIKEDPSLAADVAAIRARFSGAVA
jgi:hypothetical protein